MVQPVVRIASVTLVTGHHAAEVVFAAVGPSSDATKPHHFQVFLVENTPVIELVCIQICFEINLVDGSVGYGIIGEGVNQDRIPLLFQQSLVNQAIIKSCFCNLCSISGVTTTTLSVYLAVLRAFSIFIIYPHTQVSVSVKKVHNAYPFKNPNTT